MNRYTVKQVCEMLKISDTTLTEYTNGRQSNRGGRVEWSTPAILIESDNENSGDYERVIENGRAKLYYFDSAIEKIRAKREKKE